MNEAEAKKLVGDFAVAVAYRGDAARVAAGDKIVAALVAPQLGLEASRLALFARATGHPTVQEIMADCADCIDTENSAQHDPDVSPYDGSKWVALAAELRQQAAAIRAEDPDIWTTNDKLPQPEPLGILRRGDGGSFRLRWPENLLPIYAMAEGEHKLYAAAPAQPQPTLRDELQQKCVDWGVYWRASDAHGVDLTHEQALELLRDALGVEVEIKAQPSSPDCGEAGHAEGRCGNASCRR